MPNALSDGGGDPSPAPGSAGVFFRRSRIRRCDRRNGRDRRRCPLYQGSFWEGLAWRRKTPPDHRFSCDDRRQATIVLGPGFFYNRLRVPASGRHHSWSTTSRLTPSPSGVPARIGLGFTGRDIQTTDGQTNFPIRSPRLFNSWASKWKPWRKEWSKWSRSRAFKVELDQYSRRKSGKSGRFFPHPFISIWGRNLMSGKHKAIVLLSRGLDSTLAVKMMIDQGIDMTAIHFTSVFCIVRQRRRAVKCRPGGSPRSSTSHPGHP